MLPTLNRFLSCTSRWTWAMKHGFQQYPETTWNDLTSMPRYTFSTILCQWNDVLGKIRNAEGRSLGSHEMLIKSPKTTGGIGDSSSLLTCMYKQLCPCWTLNPWCFNHEKPRESTLPNEKCCLGTKGPNTKYVWWASSCQKKATKQNKGWKTPNASIFQLRSCFFFQKIICLTFLSKPTCSHTSSEASSIPI